MKRRYKMFPEAWEEVTDDLTLEREGAFLRLRHEVYRRGGPIANSLPKLGRIWRCSTRKAKALLSDLRESGLIEINPANEITITRKVEQILEVRPPAAKAPATLREEELS